MTDQRDGGIAWTDETWNPIRGCSRVSEGCRNCYAESVARRFSGPGQPYEGLVTVTTKSRVATREFANGSVELRTVETTSARWNGQVRFVEKHLADPLRWKRPRRVFVNSMSDLFHAELTNEQIAAVFGVMAACPQHTFQVLTKRPAAMREWFRWAESQPVSPVQVCVLAARAAGVEVGWPLVFAGVLTTGSWPLPNVWLGVSVEDQHTANERVPLLLSTRAALRWVSYEPALGPIDFERAQCSCPWPADAARTRHNLQCAADIRRPGLDKLWSLDWIVIGGESGPGARGFALKWARDVIVQARGTGTKVFVKQLGAKPGQLGPRASLSSRAGAGSDWWPLRLVDKKGGDMREWPDDLRVREWPEAAGGAA